MIETLSLFLLRTVEYEQMKRKTGNIEQQGRFNRGDRQSEKKKG